MAGEPAEESNHKVMKRQGMLSELVDLWRAFKDLLSSDVEGDRAQGHELAASARRFSRRTKKVVDDKLSFLATLMRAGELDAANRLLAEVERDVRTEEAALIESVNEVKAARALRRDRVTRVRLARTLAAAMLGASLLAFSAVGISLAGLFRDANRSQGVFVGPAEERLGNTHLRSDDARKSVSRRARKHRVRIGGVTVKLTDSQLLTYKKLTSGEVDASGLDALLLGLPAPLAARVHDLLVAAGKIRPNVRPAAKDVVAAVAEKVEKAKKKKKKPDKEAQEKEDEESGPPVPGGNQPSPEPTEPESNDKNKEKKRKGGRSSGGGDQSGPGIPSVGDDPRH